MSGAVRVRACRYVLPYAGATCFTDTNDDVVASYKGSVSAEHGVGLMKTHALHYSKSQESLALMKKIKDLFDERGIMNPGKVIV